MQYSINISWKPSDFLTLSMSNNFRLSEKYDNQIYLNDVSFSKAALSYLLVLPGKIKLVLRVTQTKCQMNMSKYNCLLLLFIVYPLLIYFKSKFGLQYSINVGVMPMDFLFPSIYNNFWLSEEYVNQPSLNDVSFSKATLSFFCVLYN